MAEDKLARPFLKEYPKQDKGHLAGQSFLSSWYKIYDWIEYSIERDALFCNVCRHFAPPSYGIIEAVFISTGFRIGKKQMERMENLPNTITLNAIKYQLVARLIISKIYIQVRQSGKWWIQTIWNLYVATAIIFGQLGR